MIMWVCKRVDKRCKEAMRGGFEPNGLTECSKKRIENIKKIKNIKTKLCLNPQ